MIFSDTELEEIQNHSLNNPRHGLNCTCMDKYIRRARNYVKQSPRLEYIFLKATK